MMRALLFLVVAWGKRGQGKSKGHGGPTLDMVARKETQLIVKFDDKSLTREEIARECGKLSQRDGVKTVNVLNAVKMCIVNVESREKKIPLKKSLTTDAKVIHVADDEIISVDKIPNDSEWIRMQHLRDIDAPAAWDIYTGENAQTDVIIAVIDTGVAYDHPDLAAHMWRNPNEAEDGLDNDNNNIADDIFGADFSGESQNEPSGDPKDENGHGTHCAGIIAAIADNNKGVTGVMWGGIKIMALKIFDANGSGLSSAAVNALDYALENGASISSNSWGGDGASTSMRMAIQVAQESGHLVIAAAGNAGENIDAKGHFPCTYLEPNVLCVTSVNSGNPGTLSEFSNYGAETVDIVAPGTEVLSTCVENGDHVYTMMSGSSMAAPVVSGTAALLKSYRRNLSGEQIKVILMASAVKHTTLEGKIVSGAVINVANALVKAQEYADVDPLPTNWSQYAQIEFSDEDPAFGAIEGMVNVRFSSIEPLVSVGYASLQWATNHSLLGEIARATLGVMSPNGNVTGGNRRLRSIHALKGEFPHRRELEELNIEVNIRAHVLAGATHLALAIGNVYGLSNEVARIELVDAGFNGKAVPLPFIDTDPRPNSVAGNLTFAGPPSEEGVSSYALMCGENAITTLDAVGMEAPFCDQEKPSDCGIVDTYWRDAETFVMARENYGPFEYVSYIFTGPGTFVFEKLHVEESYDVIRIGGREYSGNAEHTCPFHVPPGRVSVTWVSDYVDQDEGFVLVFKRENVYDVSIPPFQSSCALRIVNMNATGSPLAETEVPFTDSAIPLEVAFQDSNFEAHKLKGDLMITMPYIPSDVVGINVYLLQNNIESFYTSFSLDSTSVDFQTAVDINEFAERVHVVLVAASGELAGPKVEVYRTLTDAVGQAPPSSAVTFVGDIDSREGHILGRLLINSIGLPPLPFSHYRFYASEGSDKQTLLGNASFPGILAGVTCVTECRHLKIEKNEHDSTIVLNYFDTARPNYEGYEHMVIRITGPGILTPLYWSVEEDYDKLVVVDDDSNVIASFSDGRNQTNRTLNLTEGSYFIVWMTDATNLVHYDGWKLLWAPLAEISLDVSLESRGIFVVSVYKDGQSEMETGLFVEAPDWEDNGAVKCSEARMSCPIPHQWSAFVFHIKGAETDARCQMKTFTDNTWTGFEFAKTDCNVQRLWDFDRRVILDQVVLVLETKSTENNNRSEDAEGFAPTELLCQCESPIDGEGSFTALPMTGPNTIPVVRGNSEFRPTLYLYQDVSYSTAFPSGDSIDSTSDIFFWEVSSDYIHDILGVQSCIASPTTDFSSAFAVDLITNFCGEDVFAVEFLDSHENRRRFSMRKFSFEHQSEVYIQCNVVRCNETCGCTKRRRLITAEKGAEILLTTWFLSSAGLILSNFAPKVVFFPDQTPSQRFQDSQHVVETVVFFNSAPWLVNCDPCEVVAQSLECALAKILSEPCYAVIVTSVRQRGRRMNAHGRRLSGVEVLFSIRQPQDSALASALIDRVSDMASEGPNLAVFVSSLKEELATRIPGVDTSGLTPEVVSVTEPIVTAIEPVEPIVQEPVEPMDPVSFGETSETSSPPEKDGLAKIAYILIAIVAGSVTLVGLSAYLFFRPPRATESPQIIFTEPVKTPDRHTLCIEEKEALDMMCAVDILCDEAELDMANNQNGMRQDTPCVSPCLETYVEFEDEFDESNFSLDIISSQSPYSPQHADSRLVPARPSNKAFDMKPGSEWDWDDR